MQVNRPNYDREMQQLLQEIPAGTQLLLHSCCGPCSSAVLERLTKHFAVTVYYYNPNIWPLAEYERRRDEQLKLLGQLPLAFPAQFVEAPYDPAAFEAVAAPLAEEPERGERCAACFALRLQAAAAYAVQNGFEWFTTTLTISPHKSTEQVNRAGIAAAEKNKVRFLPSDFKKGGGYQRSLQLSAAYGLYRQSYCGCCYSHDKRFGCGGPAPNDD